jgi:hypothetical protein
MDWTWDSARERRRAPSRRSIPERSPMLARRERAAPVRSAPDRRCWRRWRGRRRGRRRGRWRGRWRGRPPLGVVVDRRRRRSSSASPVVVVALAVAADEVESPLPSTRIGHPPPCSSRARPGGPPSARADPGRHRGSATRKLPHSRSTGQGGQTRWTDQIAWQSTPPTASFQALCHGRGGVAGAVRCVTPTCRGAGQAAAAHQAPSVAKGKHRKEEKSKRAAELWRAPPPPPAQGPEASCNQRKIRWLCNSISEQRLSKRPPYMHLSKSSAQ